MIDHVTLSVKSYGEAKAFYEKVLGTLGYKLVMEVEGYAGFGLENGSHAIPDFWIVQNNEDKIGKAHIAFSAKNRDQVNQFYEAAIKSGAKDNGKPGIRENYHSNYYAAFVFDSDGYNIEAVYHDAVSENE